MFCNVKNYNLIYKIKNLNEDRLCVFSYIKIYYLHIQIIYFLKILIFLKNMCHSLIFQPQLQL